MSRMEKLFANDRGLGVLARYAEDSCLSARDRKMQYAWVRAFVAIHGGDRTAIVYRRYAAWRQKEVNRSGLTVGDSWDNLLGGPTGPTRWTRDLYTFLCVHCGERFNCVLIDGTDRLCRPCAKQETTPDQAVPLWQAYSLNELAFPGQFRREQDKSRFVSVRYDTDGQQRDYKLGEAGLLFETTNPHGLPNLQQIAITTHGDDRDVINATIQARAHNKDRSYDIIATFAYDPIPEPGEYHPYGFRLTAAHLTYAGRTTEYTDIHDLADALITGLNGEN